MNVSQWRTAHTKSLPRATSHSYHLSSRRRATWSVMPQNLCVPYLMLAMCIVHCLGLSDVAAAEPPAVAAPAQPVPAQPAPGKGWPVEDPLPPAADEVYQAILSAVHSGSISELKVPYDFGELRPDIADEPVTDPIAYWKKTSADGEGREVLAILGNLLSVGPAVVTRGQDPENNAVYVWPYLAELPLDKLTPAQQVDLLRLMPAADAKAMISKKTWTWWRLTIGADGLWHAFKRTK